MRIVTILALVILCKAEAQTSALGIADSLYLLGNYSQAINEYAKEGSSKSKLQIARAYNAIGNYDKAILEYEDLIQKEPNSQMARFELGKLFLKLNKPDRATEHFFDLLGEGTKNPEYSYYMGLSLMELGNFNEGVLNLKSAVSIDSTHLRSIFQLGKYYVSKQEKGQALEYVEKGLEFYPNDVSLINLKALSLFNDYDYKDAMPVFERLLELGEEKPHVYQKLAYCYYQLWEFEKAKNTYRGLLQFRESEPEVYNGLGHTFEKEKQLDSAEVYYKKAIAAKKPNLSPEYLALAGLARQKNDLKTALKYYELVYNQDKTNEMAFYNICTLVDQLSDDPKEKLLRYEEFLERFGKTKFYTTKLAKKRISELKEEIHMTQE